MKYKTIIFDLDGTLLDTLQDLTNSVNFALCAMGYPARTLNEVRMFVGNGIGKLIERAVPSHIPESAVLETLQIFKEHYASHCEIHTAPYAGIIELLDSLTERNVDIAVVSNKADFAVGKLCKQYFGDRISVAVGEREGVRKKPAPDSVLAVISQLKSLPKETVYIGDSEVDIETARNANIDSIIVTWGFRNKNDLIQNGASVLADSVSQLKNLLLEK